MQIETTTMIGNDRVFKTENKMGHLDIYESEVEDKLVIYFVHRNSGLVEFKMEVHADCAQNTGYIANWDLEKIQN